MLIIVPPLAAPWFGVTPKISGGSYAYPAIFDTWLPAITTTDAEPAPAGAIHVICEMFQFTVLQTEPLISTRLVPPPTPEPKWLPVMVTLLPPAVGRGEPRTAVMEGAG